MNDRIALRDAVCAYYVAQRGTGTPLGTILQSVEEILDRAEARVAGGPVDGNGQDELARQLIDWCLELDRTGKLKN